MIQFGEAPKEGEVVKFGWTVEDCRALDEYRA